MKGSLLTILSDALALHEQTGKHLLREYAADPKAKDDTGQLAGWDLELPTVNDLLVSSEVAVIKVHGLMVKRSRWWIGAGSDYLAELIEEITKRSDITTIVGDFETGGGQVAGTERLADAVWKARESGKQTIAVCNEFCASAGLWVASQFERIVIPASGSIGSLGVYTLHFDDTNWLKEMGFEKSVIHRGKYKAVDERPLDEDSKKDLQRFIDGKYSMFVDAVARGRGIAANEVIERWGDSQLFTGSEAVSSGLADEIGTLQDVLESLRAGRGGRVSISIPPADDEEGDPNAMKLNATGQILDTAGKVVGNISELQIDAAGLSKYFASQTGELIESAVKTAKDAAAETQKAALAEQDKARAAHLDALVAAVGPEKAIAAFKAGDSVEKAKASMADDLAAQLKAKEAELAELKAAGGKKAPEFIATDGGGRGDGKKAEDKADDKDAPYAAAWNANTDSCQSSFPDFKTYAAYCRNTNPVR